MFGSEYWKNPQILLSSFEEMHHSYKKRAKKIKPNFLINYLQKLYIGIFGIPEIGFQLRSLYFEKILNEKLKKSKFSKILDAGSGIGMYSFWLAREYPKALVVGGDIDWGKLSFSRDFAKQLKVKNTEFMYLDITKQPKTEEKYDFVVSIDVLEHIKDYKKVLINFHSLLLQNGYLYIHTPQPDQKRIFKSLKKWSHEGHVHEGYTPQELHKELKKLGFKIVESRQTFGFFGKLSWELNHMFVKKSFLLAGLTYPFLYAIACFDFAADNRNGLGTAILAKKTV